MARVRPFAAYRYARPERDISAVTAPPYDVITASQRDDYLAVDPHNVVALELPDGPLDPLVLGNRYETGASTWNEWRSSGVLALDAEPAVYVLEQRFEYEGQLVRRRAFIVEVGLEPFDAGVVLPHERTLPKALDDRFELTRATGANLSQVLALFDDAAGETDDLFERAVASTPVATAVDTDGVESSLWLIGDTDFALSLSSIMAEKSIFIADGHHRYGTALAYRDLRRGEVAGGIEPPIDPPYDFVMMALVNMDDPELVVMPTHRVADAPCTFDSRDFYTALGEHFEIEELPAGRISSRALDGFETPVFIVKTRDDDLPRRIRVRDEVDLDSAIASGHSTAWKHLDVAVLQELVLDPLLDVHPDRPETLERLRFFKSAEEALDATSQHDVAFVLRPTSMQQLRTVATGGETMPQKSTYFFPKLLSGLVFRNAE